MMTFGMRDLKYAMRGFGRDPLFAAVTVLTLALGIGSVSAVYSVVDGVLLEPLPYDDPGELVTVAHGAPGLDVDRIPNARAAYVVYREASRSLQALALHQSTALNLTGTGDPIRITGRRVTPTLFDVLRTTPALGRTFTEAEGLEDTDVVILSHGLWTESFGADPDVLGRTVALDGVSHEIVGVMPPDFAFPDQDVRLWIPMVVDPTSTSFTGFNEEGIGRLADGVTVDAARREIQGLIPRVVERHPEISPMVDQMALQAVVHPYVDDIVGDVRTSLWVLLATVGFVLLIVCANVANLMLVRAEGRRREVAVRTAIGAGRGHLLGQFMAESVTLSALGASLGVGLAWQGLVLLRRIGADSVPRMHQVGLDGSVLLATVVVTAACAVVFGLIPVLRHRSARPGEELRDGNRSSTGGGKGLEVRELLVAAQVALALMLLVGSGLMVRSFAELQQVDPGFDATDVLTFRISLPGSRYDSAEEIATFHRSLLDRIDGLPGVRAAGAVSQLPVTGMSGINGFYDADEPPAEGEIAAALETRAATPGYFEALGISVRQGRGPRWTDGADSPPVLFLSTRAAEIVLGAPDPTGRQVVEAINADPEAPRSTVVGVVGDVHNVSLVEAPMGTVYYAPLVGEGLDRRWLTRSMSYAVRTASDPLALVPAVRNAVGELDAQLPVAAVETMEARMDRAQARTVFTMTMLALGAFMGLVLGAVGLYGVVSYVTARRTREIGLRMALGAEASSVLGLVLKRGMIITGAGLVVGLVGAWGGTRFLQSLLYDVEATDPATYGTVTGMLLAVSFLASFIPARRASRVDVVEALRTE